jgi:hypothetical protein
VNLTRSKIRGMIKEELQRILLEQEGVDPELAINTAEPVDADTGDTPPGWLVNLHTYGPRWVHELRSGAFGHPAIIDLLDFVENKMEEIPLLFDLLDQAIPDIDAWKMDAVTTDLHQTGALLDAYDGAGGGEKGSQAMSDLIKSRYQYMESP